MFARTLTLLFLCAAPALAAPPEAPMPRAVQTVMSSHHFHLWWQDDEPPVYPQRTRPDLRRDHHAPHRGYDTGRGWLPSAHEEVYRLAAQNAPVPRSPAELHPMWYDPEVCPPDALRQWHQMSFDALRSTVYGPFVCTQNLREDVFHLAAGAAPRPHEKRVAQLFVFGLVQLEGAPAPTRTGQLVFSGSVNSDRPLNCGEFKDLIRGESRAEFVAAPPAPEPLVCPPCPLPKIEVNPLLGTWYREVPGCVACATFTHDELKLTFAESDGAKHTATAQYTVTKDGLVFGAITGTTGPASLVDVPFSFRFRVTSDGVMVSAFKSEPMGDTARFCGLFKCAKDGKVPAPVAAKPALGAAVGTGLLPPNAGSNIGAPLIDPVRPAALETRPAVLPPALDGPPPMPPARPNASAPPDALKNLAEHAFSKLLSQKDLSLPTVEPENPLVPPRLLEHYPQSFAPVAPPAKKLAHVGTWHRELGPMTCVVKIDAEHVTITTTVSGEENGKKMKHGVVVTGDYHRARDGTTLVGLVTGLDVVLEGVTGKDAQMLDGLEDVAKLQKALAGQPFALTVRAYGDALVIGDVRVGQAGERGIGEASAMVAGRYKSGEPKAAGEPKVLPRATGASVPRIPMSDEDLSILQNEWRRFWFPDAPSKLTPERVRGGIY